MTVRRPRRLARLGLLVVAAVPLLAASPALAGTVTIGSTTLAANGGTPDLFGQNVPVFQGDAAGGYQTSSSVTGTISSWRFRSAGVDKGSRFVLRVLRPAGGGTWRAVATSAPAAVTSATGTDAVLGPFAAAIAVLPGDRIALQPIDAGYTPIEAGTNGKDGVRYFTAPLGDGSTASLAPGSGSDNGQIVPIQATVDVVATALSNTSPPSVSETAAVGQTLTCSPGTWSAKPDTVAFSWQRDGTAIPGAAAATYAVAAGDAGHALSCTATATAGAASGAAASAALQIPAAPVAPANTTAPRVAGVVKPGSTVSCDPGTWTGSPALAYAWTWESPRQLPTFRLRSGSRLVGPTKGLSFRASPRRPVTVQALIARTQTLVVPDLPAGGGTLGCTVTASGGGSAAVAAVSPQLVLRTLPPSLGRSSVTATFHPPTITPNVGAGSTNTCRPGYWAHYPTFTYAWYSLGRQRHSSGPPSRRLLARGPTLKLAPYHEGLDIECILTATNPAGSVSLASNDYVVPRGAPHPLQRPFVDVSTEGPTTAPGLVGPEGATVIAEKIHLRCLNGHWDRGDLTFHTSWQEVDQNGTLLPNSSFPGDRVDYDMSPGKAQASGDIACVVTATTSHDVSATVVSGTFAIWNGCIEGPSGQYFQQYFSGFAPSFAGSVAANTDAEISAFDSAFGLIGETWYTVGPNCLDYQKWLESKGYTVKQQAG